MPFCRLLFFSVLFFCFAVLRIIVFSFRHGKVMMVFIRQQLFPDISLRFFATGWGICDKTVVSLRICRYRHGLCASSPSVEGGLHLAKENKNAFLFCSPLGLHYLCAVSILNNHLKTILILCTAILQNVSTAPTTRRYTT